LLDTFFLCFFSFAFIIKIQEKKRDRLIYICLKEIERERERYIEGTCSNDHMKINIEQKMCRNNKDEKRKEENETKHRFCLEQCIVENKPKTDTHTHI